MASYKKLIFKGTSRQVFIRVYRLEIKLVMLVFSNKYTEYKFTVCVWGGGGVPFRASYR
jgi:hypothetical protein